MKMNVSRFLRLKIADKFFLGFVSLGVLTVLIAFIALSSLQRLNDINRRIVDRDIPLAQVADKMVEALLAQELYGRRSLILESSEMEALFWKRSEEFKKLLQQLSDFPDGSRLPLARLGDLHDEYNDLFKAGLEREEPSFSKIFQDHDRQIRQKQEELIQLAKKISLDAREDQKEKSRETLMIGSSAFRMTAWLIIGGLLLGIMVALAITRNISRSIDLLRLSTQKISEGKFEHLPEIRSQDELGHLSRAFGEMARRLKRLEEMCLDANPLTRLPGSTAIEGVMNKRLKEKAPVAFCLLDLSHFKAFNDRYGYVRGNEVIQETARMLVDVVNPPEDKEAFVGHIGGDDFVVITSPERCEEICLGIIHSFDKRVLDFYDPEDRRRGYIRGKTREGTKVSFPIMTMAIAVVTNKNRRLKNHIQVGEIAAELKTRAKSFSRSGFIVDRRTDDPSRREGEGGEE